MAGPSSNIAFRSLGPFISNDQCIDQDTAPFQQEQKWHDHTSSAILLVLVSVQGDGSVFPKLLSNKGLKARFQDAITAFVLVSDHVCKVETLSNVRRLVLFSTSLRFREA